GRPAPSPGRSSRSQAVHDRDTALAQRRMRRVLPDARAPRPTALALLPAQILRRHHLDGEAGNVLALVADRGSVRRPLEQAHARDVEECREERPALLLQQRPPLFLGRTRDVDDRVDTLADASLLARRLEGA